eukprot:ANDGO_00049.mRNA.1 hypothetical protein
MKAKWVNLISQLISSILVSGLVLYVWMVRHVYLHNIISMEDSFAVRCAKFAVLMFCISISAASIASVIKRMFVSLLSPAPPARIRSAPIMKTMKTSQKHPAKS